VKSFHLFGGVFALALPDCHLHVVQANLVPEKPAYPESAEFPIEPAFETMYARTLKK
jgi:hypothetical protein